AIDDAVRSILGEEVLQALLVHLLTFQRLARDEIPHRLNIFFPALENAFGPVSGKTLGRFIVKLLYARLGLEFRPRSDLTLLGYVEQVRAELGVGN
ncbi:MAG TPA: hypothetical protein VLV18_03165, partial [Terriglobales bacterium]|nr:hypothetical protein [Terriglobales bacterium]